MDDLSEHGICRKQKRKTIIFNYSVMLFLDMLCLNTYTYVYISIKHIYVIVKSCQCECHRLYFLFVMFYYKRDPIARIVN